MNWYPIIGFVTLALSAGLMLFFSVMFRKAKPHWRKIPVIESLKKHIGLSVEDGSRLHLSIGSSNLLTPESMAALSALAAFKKITQNTLQSDRPPIITAGDSTLMILAQDTIKSVSHTPEGRSQALLQGRVSGLTPFSYASGALDEMNQPFVKANALVGHYGIELGLLTDQAEKSGNFVMAASDDLASQAVAYASVPQPLIGEELYAISAYLDSTPIQSASIRVQDIFRWLIVLIILVGAILNLVGVL